MVIEVCTAQERLVASDSSRFPRKPTNPCPPLDSVPVSFSQPELGWKEHSGDAYHGVWIQATEAVVKQEDSCPRAPGIRDIASTSLRQEVMACQSPHNEMSPGASVLWDRYGKPLQGFLTNARYREAVALGRTIWSELPGFADLSSIDDVITLANIHLLYARALIYTAQTCWWRKILQDIISELEAIAPLQPVKTSALGERQNQRFRLVLGRTHNDLGYAYNLNLGRPHSALPELQSAVVNFHLGNLHEELANTYDNMGHVYARLNNHAIAVDLIEKGLSIRRALGDEHRTGLSLNSGAVAYLGSAKLSDARESAEEALGIMRRLNSPRGIGLTSITLGRVMCSLGDCLAVHAEPGERRRCLEESESHLQRAVVIFERDVDEPLRLVHALRELAHLYEVMSNSIYCSVQIRRQVAELQLKARLIAMKRGFCFSETRLLGAFL